MPRYFIHVEEWLKDTEGEQFVDDEAAAASALRAMAELAESRRPAILGGALFRISVEDGSGARVCALELRRV